jgi:hypothetical protein
MIDNIVFVTSYDTRRVTQIPIPEFSTCALLIDELNEKLNAIPTFKETLDAQQFWYRRNHSHNPEKKCTDMEYVFNKLCEHPSNTYTINFETLPKLPSGSIVYKNGQSDENRTLEYRDGMAEHRRRSMQHRGTASEIMLQCLQTLNSRVTLLERSLTQT